MSGLLKQWYAVYTKSRSEKKLFSLLCSKGVECFLPLRKELRQRSDRKKWVELPLLPSYLFVQISEKDRFDVLNTPGAVRYIIFDGKPATIPVQQIAYLQNLVESKSRDLEVCYGAMDPGEYVEVTSGPLRGIKGEVLQIKGKYRIVLRFESLGCSVHAEISASELSLVGSNSQH